METEAEWETEGSILAYIAEHPGTRLVEIEEALEINRLEAAQGVRALLDQGRIRRDEETRQYFPA
jgi:predicted transcriptional regulator